MAWCIRVICVLLLAAAAKSSQAQDLKLRATLAQEMSYISTPHAVALSPDERLLFSGGITSSEVLVWNTTNNVIEFRLQGHASPVRCVAYAPGIHDSGPIAGTTTSSTTDTTPAAPQGKLEVKLGGVLATGDTMGTIKLWELAQKKETATLKGHKQPLFALSFSRDGKELASVGVGGEVKLWDVAAKKVKQSTRLAGAFGIGSAEYDLPGTAISYNSVAIGPGARFLAAGASMAVAAPIIELWDLQTGRLHTRLAGHSERGFAGNSVDTLQFSGDGKTLLSAGKDGVKTWDVANKKFKAHLYAPPQGRSPDPILFPSLKSPGHAGPAAWSPNQKLVALSVGQIALVEIGSRKVKHVIHLGIFPAGGSDTPPLGQVIGGGLRDWISFSPSGQALVIPHVGKQNNVRALSAGGLSLWTVDSSEPKGIVGWGTHAVKWIAFSPNGQLLASVDINGIVRVWDLKTNHAMFAGKAGKALSVGFRDNGKTLIWTTANDAAPRQAFIHQMDLATRKTNTLKCEKDFSGRGVFSLDGALFASQTSEGVSLVDVSTRRSIRVLKGSASGLRFCADGKTLVGAVAGRFHFWDVANGELKKTFPRLDERGLDVVRANWAVSPGGEAIARNFDPEKAEVLCSVFSPDGRMIALGCHDGRITLWEVPEQVKTTK